MANLSGEQMEQARKLWADGENLGSIAETLRCSVYDLSPWLYADEINAALAEVEQKLRSAP